MRHRPPCRRGSLPVVLVAAALAVTACGDEPSVGGGETARPSSASTEGLPPKLAANAAQADQIVGEGIEDFEKRLEQLRGHPVVVNQWASWCTSCRAEFPFFKQAADRYRDRVAFVGLDSQDERDSAERFQKEVPAGFPSIFDPDAKVAAAYGAGSAWPTTIFLDAEGKVVHVKIGGYATAKLLDDDISRHALGAGG